MKFKLTAHKRGMKYRTGYDNQNDMSGLLNAIQKLIEKHNFTGLVIEVIE